MTEGADKRDVVRTRMMQLERESDAREEALRAALPVIDSAVATATQDALSAADSPMTARLAENYRQLARSLKTLADHVRTLIPETIGKEGA